MTYINPAAGDTHGTKFSTSSENNHLLFMKRLTIRAQWAFAEAKDGSLGAIHTWLKSMNLALL